MQAASIFVAVLQDENVEASSLRHFERIYLERRPVGVVIASETKLVQHVLVVRQFFKKNKSICSSIDIAALQGFDFIFGLWGDYEREHFITSLLSPRKTCLSHAKTKVKPTLTQKFNECNSQPW